jgi:hypothetical protein
MAVRAGREHHFGRRPGIDSSTIWVRQQALTDQNRRWSVRRLQVGHRRLIRWLLTSKTTFWMLSTIGRQGRQIPRRPGSQQLGGSDASGSCMEKTSSAWRRSRKRTTTAPLKSLIAAGGSGHEGIDPRQVGLTIHWQGMFTVSLQEFLIAGYLAFLLMLPQSRDILICTTARNEPSTSGTSATA